MSVRAPPASRRRDSAPQTATSRLSHQGGHFAEASAQKFLDILSSNRVHLRGGRKLDREFIDTKKHKYFVVILLIGDTYGMHQLKYFAAVAEEGSFARAAERMQVAQPSLSRQMQELDAQVGHSLFDRLSRRVTATEAGRQLLPYARRIPSGLLDPQRCVRPQMELRHWRSHERRQKRPTT
jgi:hypothetical protein